MCCCLFLTILQNEIQDFVLNFELSTLGSERVKRYDDHPVTFIILWESPGCYSVNLVFMYYLHAFLYKSYSSWVLLLGP